MSINVQTGWKKVVQWSGDQWAEFRSAITKPRIQGVHKKPSGEGYSRFANKATNVVMWFSFAAFLVASLPHVAYFFAAFEPQEWYVWPLAYALAVSIDATAFLLSYNVARKMRLAMLGKSVAGAILNGLFVFVTHWPFILVLVAFSWVVNFEHAVEFTTPMLARVDAILLTIPWLNVQFTIGQLNPLMASAFSVLTIAYTVMSDLNIGEQSTSSPSSPPTDRVNELAETVNTLKDELRVLSNQHTTLIKEWKEAYERMKENQLKVSPVHRQNSELIGQFTSELEFQQASTEISASSPTEQSTSERVHSDVSSPVHSKNSESGVQQANTEINETRARVFAFIVAQPNPLKANVEDVMQVGGIGRTRAFALKKEFALLPSVRIEEIKEEVGQTK